MSKGESSTSEAERRQGQVTQGLACHGEESDFLQWGITGGFQIREELD